MGQYQQWHRQCALAFGHQRLDGRSVLPDPSGFYCGCAFFVRHAGFVWQSGEGRFPAAPDRSVTGRTHHQRQDLLLLQFGTNLRLQGQPAECRSTGRQRNRAGPQQLYLWLRQSRPHLVAQFAYLGAWPNRAFLQPTTGWGIGRRHFVPFSQFGARQRYLSFCGKKPVQDWQQNQRGAELPAQLFPLELPPTGQ